MTTINDVRTILDAVQTRIETEMITTGADVNKMISGLREARTQIHAALSTAAEAFDLTIDQTIMDLEAMGEGRTKAIEEAIGERLEPVAFRSVDDRHD
jgi:hypothetical protein